jgi:hypothetical protein
MAQVAGIEPGNWRTDCDTRLAVNAADRLHLIQQRKPTMRNTESAQEMFNHAHDFFNWRGGDPRQPSDMDVRKWLAGMRSLAMGLSDLAVAVRDIYDKLERVHPKIVGTLERIPPKH